MSRLLVITRPFLVTGFQLAGVDAFGVEDSETAEGLITTWLDRGESGLLAIDEEILEALAPALVARLEDSADLPYLAIPGARSGASEKDRLSRTARMIHRAVGFHITFRGED